MAPRATSRRTLAFRTCGFGCVTRTGPGSRRAPRGCKALIKKTSVVAGHGPLRLVRTAPDPLLERVRCPPPALQPERAPGADGLGHCLALAPILPAVPVPREQVRVRVPARAAPLRDEDRVGADRAGHAGVRTAHHAPP